MHGGMSEELWLSHEDELRPQLDLQERIWDALHAETEYYDTADVLVWVNEFVATLRGSVTSYPARIAMERIVARVPGVRATVNELSVVLPEMTPCFLTRYEAALRS